MPKECGTVSRIEDLLRELIDQQKTTNQKLDLLIQSQVELMQCLAEGESEEDSETELYLSGKPRR